MVPMIPTIETISVACLTEDQEDGDLILDLMVDGINKVSLVIGLFSYIFHHQQNNSKWNYVQNAYFYCLCSFQR